MGKNKDTKYYAVAVGRKTGVFLTWDACKEQVHRFPSARFKSFTKEEEAQNFVEMVRGAVAALSSAKASANDQSSISLEKSRRQQQPLQGQGGTGKSTVVEANESSLGQIHVRSRDDEDRRERKLPKITKSADRPDCPPAERPEQHNLVWGETRLKLNDDRILQQQRLPPPRFVSLMISFDGGARGNPGPSAAGVVLVWVEQQSRHAAGAASSTLSESSHGSAEFRQVTYLREYLGDIMTNNQAEYRALLLALNWATTCPFIHQPQSPGESLDDDASAARLDSLEFKDANRFFLVDCLIQGDSDLVIKQMQGKYQVKSPSLLPLYRQAQSHLVRLRQLLSLGQQRAIALAAQHPTKKVPPGTVRWEHIERALNRKADELANQAMDARRSWMTFSTDNHEIQHPLVPI